MLVELWQENTKLRREKMDYKTILHNYTYHPPKGDQTERYEKIRNEVKLTAILINDLCPDGREKSLALTNLEQAVMWANAAIARGEV
jgi:hypothetical protein